jgi:S1-C subfamily serine protease
LIAMNAQLEPGDSGGPLMNTADEVIGMDTAAAIRYRGVPTGPNYAIPIDQALTIVKQIETGVSSTKVHIGATAFLGVALGIAPTRSGALVEGVAPGSAAAAAGLTAGDWITSIDGHPIASPTALQSTLVIEKVGVPVSLRYVDVHGTTKTTTVRLTSGPPE